MNKDETVIKFTTKKARGWIDVGGTRMNLVDIPGCWYSIKNLIATLAGPETLRRVMFESGNNERFTLNALESGFITPSTQGFMDAVDCYSEAGFGDFKVKEIDFDKGYAFISCKDSFEGWSLQANKEKAAKPTCDYSRGVLLSFMQKLTKKDNLMCIEIQCIGTGASECQYVIDEEQRLVEKGFELPLLGKSIKERAEELMESEEKYRNLVERANDGICIIQDTLLRYVNPQLSLMLGYSVEEVINTPFVRYVHANGMTKCIDSYYRRMAGEDDVIQKYETVFKDKDGHAIDVEVNAGIITYGNRPADLVFIRDITKRKQMEKEAIKTEKLATAVQIASEAAHEVKNPLAVISAGLYYLERILPENEEAHNTISKMNHAAQRAVTYINDLLNFARPIELKKVKININEVIKKALDELPDEILSNIDVQQELNSNLPDILADFDRLKQVVTNLVKNAAEAMWGGKGRRLRVQSEKGWEVIKISVSDTGKGIREEDIGHIFSPFFTTKGKGTGLGLSICQRIIEAHDGGIEIKSEMGKGTTFVVKLPMGGISAR